MASGGLLSDTEPLTGFGMARNVHSPTHARRSKRRGSASLSPGRMSSTGGTGLKRTDPGACMTLGCWMYVFGYCDNSGREKDLRCRKRGTHAPRARQDDLAGVTRAAVPVFLVHERALSAPVRHP